MLRWLINEKNLSGCEDCGEDNSILTQISSGPQPKLLCSDCYKLRYSNETQNKINHAEEED